MSLSKNLTLLLQKNHFCCFSLVYKAYDVASRFSFCLFFSPEKLFNKMDSLFLAYCLELGSGRNNLKSVMKLLYKFGRLLIKLWGRYAFMFEPVSLSGPEKHKIWKLQKKKIKQRPLTFCTIAG